MDRNQVAVVTAEKKEYPGNAPFHPPEKFPEYPYAETDDGNAVYPAVRELFIKLELDKDNYGTKDWNPLGEIVRPGDSVVVKPNFVSGPRSENTDPRGLVTHASIIRPVIDYTLIALKGKGSLAVADSPQNDSDFEKIKEITGIQGVIDFINGRSPLKVDLLDLREEYARTVNGIVLERVKTNGDPRDYTVVNLGTGSAFHDIEAHTDKIYGAHYDVEKVREHHTNNRHEYCIANTVLNADVVINIPKLKTHKKAGVTICLKNIIGINGNKNYLPHYRFGSREEGGDQYLKSSPGKALSSRFYQFVFRVMSRLGPNQMKLMIAPRKIYSFLNSRNIAKHHAGSWYGNDTIWRTIVDLNKILFFADGEGKIRDRDQRQCFNIVDGIVGGEDDGPLCPTARPCGVILGGLNPVLVDRAGIEIMGFNYANVPQVVMAAKMLGFDIGPAGNIANINLRFTAPEQWRGKLERD